MTETEVERVKLPMVCVCGKPDEPNLRKEKADARREQAKALLTWNDENPCTDANFLSRAVANLQFSFNAEFEYGVDQWFGAYSTVKKYVECDHEDDKCPDEPECFVYRWDDVLKVRVECDRLEDGLAELVIWFHENRKDRDE